MEQDYGLRDTQESTMQDPTNPQHHDPQGTRNIDLPMEVDMNKKIGRGPAIGIAILAIVIATSIFINVRSRVHAEERLTKSTNQVAITDVAVTKPSIGANALEVSLPANTQAFIDTPIYARTSGYMKKWYFDIGAHVRKGQLLATIETPELDEQVRQAQSDIKTAQANQQIAQITSDRWQKLLAKEAVSTQEADQASSTLAARNSALSSAQDNLRRLEQLQSFEKIVAPFDGTITARNIDIGSLIQADNSSSAKVELFHMPQRTLSASSFRCLRSTRMP